MTDVKTGQDQEITDEELFGEPTDQFNKDTQQEINKNKQEIQKDLLPEENQSEKQQIEQKRQEAEDMFIAGISELPEEEQIKWLNRMIEIAKKRKELLDKKNIEKAQQISTKEGIANTRPQKDNLLEKTPVPSVNPKQALDEELRENIKKAS